MNKQETIKIIAIIKVAYPKFFVSDDKEEARLQIDTWTELFSSDPYQLVEQAVKSLMCVLKYPPTIADIKEKIAFITQPQTLTEMEAWGKVLKGIQDANYHAQDHFDSFHPVIQKIIGSPNQLREWAQMDSETVNSVIQSNFMRSYTEKVKTEKEYAALPESAKVMIESATRKMIGEAI